MYASCYILTKIENLVPVTPKTASRGSRDGSVDLEKLEI
jgi:betaine lipid synthase